MNASIWTRLVGVAILILVGFNIYRGRVSLGDNDSSYRTTLRRSEKPVQFWLYIIVMLIFAGILIFNIFHLF